jgi:hypothetical protein
VSDGTLAPIIAQRDLAARCLLGAEDGRLARQAIATSRGEGDVGNPSSSLDVLRRVRLCSTGVAAQWWCDDRDYADLMHRASEIVLVRSLYHDSVIWRAFVSSGRFEQEQTPFLPDVRREGVPI